MLNRLLDATYSAFDRDAHPNAAFRAQHAYGLKWAIRDRVLTAQTETGTPLAVIGLRGKTIDQVVELLAGVGCAIVYQNPELSSRAADSLIAGSGAQSQSNGDLFAVYDSLLYSVLDAYAVALEDANVDVEAAIRQLYLGTAEGEWIDEWGSYFGLPREDGEADEEYRVRLLVETLRPRVNALAIEKAVLDMTGKQISLYEPWRDIFILSEDSALSGEHRLHDGNFYTFNIIQPQSAVPIDWKKPLSIIDRNRPAGTIVKKPVFRPGTRFASFYPSNELPTPWFAQEDVRSSFMHSTDPNALGYLALSDYQEIVNYKCNIFTLASYSNAVGANIAQKIGPAEYYVKASVCLSEDAELGDVNCIFGAYRRIDESDFIVLSGDADSDAYPLSDMVAGPSWESYEEVFYRSRASSLDLAVGMTGEIGRFDSHFNLVRRLPGALWVDGWDGRTWIADRIWSNIGLFTAP